MIPAAEVAAVIEAATLAPSSHNSQPWRFTVADDVVIELIADRERALRVNDPDDRELVVSCGAALLHLRVAAEARGLRPDVLCGPTGDLLARVRLTEVGHATSRRLAAAIPRRHTHRGAFDGRALPPGLPDRLVRAAEEEGAHLSMLGRGPQREAVEDLVHQGDRLLFADPAWRRELAAWMRPRRSGEGLPVPPVVGTLTRTVVSHVDLGRGTAKRDADLVRDAPAVAVLWTAGDRPADRLAAGQALARVALTAAGSGVALGFANQPCQVADLRPRLATALHLLGHPQVVLRLGFPPRGQIQDFHHIRRAQSAYGMTSAESTGSSQAKFATANRT